MRLNWTDFPRKCQHVLLLALGCLPLTMMLGANYAPDQMTAVYAFSCMYVLLGWGCLLIPGRRRILAGVLSALLLAAGGFTLLPWQGHIPLLLLPAMHMALLAITLPIGGWPCSRELPVAWHVAGVVTHLLLQLLVSASRQGGVLAYGELQTPLLCSFLTYAALVVLAMNRTSLESASQSRRTVPLLMRRQNLVLTLGFGVLAVLIAAIPAIGKMLADLWDWLKQGISWLAALLSKLLPEGSGAVGGGGGGGMGDMGLGEAAPPSAFALFMEKVVAVLALIVILVALVLLGRILLKKLRKLVQLLWARMMHYGAAASEDYEDEITSTLDEPDTERGRALRFGMRHEKDAADATPNGQIRARYRQLKRRHRWQSAQTARETLPERSAALYERVRYGGESLTPAEAERFKEDTKRL